MCGFYFSNINRLDHVDNLKRRGPDEWNYTEIKELGHFGSARLTTMGEVTKQPVITEWQNNTKGVLLYNGSCYNSDITGNDTKWISDQLSDQNYSDFVPWIRDLDGEYSLAWATPNQIFFCTDAFGMRPLYYYYDERGVSIASLADTIVKKHKVFYRCQPNLIYIYDNNSKQLKTFVNKEFDLKQTVNNYDRVWELWEKAVKDRYTAHSSILMSSGYDSGMIACTAKKFFNDLDCYYVKNPMEVRSVIKQRIAMHEMTVIELLKGQSPDTIFGNRNHPYHQSLLDMCPDIEILKSNTWCNAGDREICIKHMNPKGKRVLLGGDGGDDIYSDYGYHGKRMRKQSRFGGDFPGDLDTVWPWTQNNVFKDFHNRTEITYGYYGIEYRCPFMSTELIQAWLNTTQSLKNKKYKGWMAQYMLDHNYPYADMESYQGKIKMGYWHFDDRVSAIYLSCDKCKEINDDQNE